MTDFRWFRLLLFCLGLYFVGTGAVSLLQLGYWLQEMLTSSLSGSSSGVGRVLIGTLFAGIPHVLSAGFGVYLMRGGGALTRWILKRVENNCARCDYGLREVTGNRCPECGLDFDRTKIDAEKVTAPSTT